MSGGTPGFAAANPGANSSATPSDPYNSGDGSNGETGRLLDGFLVLASGGFGLPDDAVTANLSSLEIVEVSDDLRFFPNLDSLDLSDNRLNYREVLEHLFVTPRLTKINLSCNGICRLNCRRNPLSTHISSYDTLSSLDLSYNELHGDVLISLACLPHLEKLNLTANCISSIPPEESLEGFPKLAELVLDANDLVQFDQWRSLDSLRNLRQLSLRQNRIRRLRLEDEEEEGGLFPKLEVLDLQANDFLIADQLEAILMHDLHHGTGTSSLAMSGGGGGTTTIGTATGSGTTTGDVNPNPHAGDGTMISAHSPTNSTFNSGSGASSSSSSVMRARMLIERDFSLLDKFQSLKVVKVSQPGFPRAIFRGKVLVETSKTKKWYMCPKGNLSHNARDKQREVNESRQQKLGKRSFRMVQSTRPLRMGVGGGGALSPGGGNKGKPQFMGALEGRAGSTSPGEGFGSDEELQKALYSDTLERVNARTSRMHAGSLVVQPVDLIGKYLDDEGIDEIFARRRQQIDDLVERRVAEMGSGGAKSYLNRIPFALSSDSQSMMIQAVKEQHEGPGGTGRDDRQDYFARYSDEKMLETPRTPIEVLQQKKKRFGFGGRGRGAMGADHYATGAGAGVEIPIDIRRSLEALKDAMFEDEKKS
eukprot:g14786.t1